MFESLSIVVLLSLVTHSLAEEVPSKSFSCESISSIPPEQRCTFASQECEASRIPWLSFYYCTIEPHGWLTKAPYISLLFLILLPLLFTLLADTAELYFSPTMALIAQSIPKMRPRFAGVTFVAMGNGAPDLSANISAIRSGSIQLSAGAITGAAMFVQCIVASEVIRISLGTNCRGAMMRDVGFYAACLALVAASFSSGRITRWFVALALILYCVYALWVFLGDEWHERGRPRPSGITWDQIQSLLLRRKGSRSASAEGPTWASLDPVEESISTHLLSGGGEGGEGREAVRRSLTPLMDSHTYRDAVWADLGSDEGLLKAVKVKVERSQASRGGDGGGILNEVEMEAGPLHDAELATSSGTNEAMHLLAETSKHEADVVSMTAWESICSELTLGESRHWHDLPLIRRRWRQATFKVLLPAYFLLRLSVPLVDPGTYDQQWLVVSILFSPLAAFAYFGAPGGIGVTIGLAVLGILLALVVHLMTKDEEGRLPPLDLGTGVPLGPATFSLLGFFMGILWIDSLASEVVGILGLVANLAGLPSSLVGLTLLAWGGSLGDFFGNSALARRGHASTALTACFAGPLFNLLVALSLGFTARFAQTGKGEMEVQLTPDVALGCVFLLVYAMVVAGVGWINGQKLPERFYLFARGYYAVYLILATFIALMHQ